VSVDVARYGAIARGMSHYFKESPLVVAAINLLILDFILKAFTDTGVSVDKIDWSQAGDGGIFFVETAKDAVAVACTLQKVMAAQHLTAKTADEQIHFRVGVSTGDVVVQRQRKLRPKYFVAGGIPIIDAVRLQAFARTGEVVVCEKTYQSIVFPIGSKKKIQWSADEFHRTKVPAKDHEHVFINARKIAVVPRASWDTGRKSRKSS
jgi:class 3 adenylate cyclase